MKHNCLSILVLMLCLTMTSCSNADVSVSYAKKQLETLSIPDRQYCVDHSALGRFVYDVIANKAADENSVESFCSSMSGLNAQLLADLQPGLAKNVYRSIMKNNPKNGDELDAISVVECVKLKKGSK